MGGRLSGEHCNSVLSLAVGQWKTLNPLVVVTTLVTFEKCRSYFELIQSVIVNVLLHNTYTYNIRIFAVYKIDFSHQEEMLYSLAYLLFFAYIFLKWWRDTKFPHKLFPPGPIGFPLLGHLPTIRSENLPTGLTE